MSEDNQVAEQQETEVQETKVDIQAIIAENEKLKKDLKTVADHKDKLYQETKKAKAEREQAETEAKRTAEEKAKKDGEFENLWKTAKQREEELARELQAFKTSHRQEKLQVSAMKVATELADGPNAEILSDFIVRNLDKLSDETGTLSVDVLEEVKKEFASNEKFKALLRGSKASGGAAQGNTRATPSSPQEMTRAEFAKLPPLRQQEFAAKIRTGQATLLDN